VKVNYSWKIQDKTVNIVLSLLCEDGELDKIRDLLAKNQVDKVLENVLASLPRRVFAIDFLAVAKALEGTKYDDGLVVQQILSDVEKIGAEKATQYVLRFSPSKLGRLGLLGLRKLAIIKRDNPEDFKKIIRGIKPEISFEETLVEV